MRYAKCFTCAISFNPHEIPTKMYYSHFAEEDTEAQNGEMSSTEKPTTSEPHFKSRESDFGVHNLMLILPKNNYGGHELIIQRTNKQMAINLMFQSQWLSTQ